MRAAVGRKRAYQRPKASPVCAGHIGRQRLARQEPGWHPEQPRSRSIDLEHDAKLVGYQVRSGRGLEQLQVTLTLRVELEVGGGELLVLLLELLFGDPQLLQRHP